MKKLKLHDEAEAELSEIFLYYADKNPDLALRFYQEITDSFSHILRQPKMGAPIETPYRKYVTQPAVLWSVGIWELLRAVLRPMRDCVPAAVRRKPARSNRRNSLRITQ